MFNDPFVRNLDMDTCFVTETDTDVVLPPLTTKPLKFVVPLKFVWISEVSVLVREVIHQTLEQTPLREMVVHQTLEQAPLREEEILQKSVEKEEEILQKSVEKVTEKVEEIATPSDENMINKYCTILDHFADSHTFEALQNIHLKVEYLQ